MIDLSKTFNEVTDDSDEVIFPKNSLGVFHTSMFARTVATTEDISFLFTGEIQNKTKPLFWSLHYHTT